METREEILDYLYGELSPAERETFKNELSVHPELREEVNSLLQLRQLCKQHLPDERVPEYLSKKLLADLGIRRPWYEAFSMAFLRPAFAGATALAVMVGIGVQVQKSYHEPQANLAQHKPDSKASQYVDSGLDLGDLLLANNSVSPNLRMRGKSGYASLSTAPVTLASYGGAAAETQNRFQAGMQMPSDDIYNLDQEADLAVAQFIHKQALRLRSMGDFNGAAQNLAYIIKNYPSYPQKLQALAQRVDCLFAAGEFEAAQKELTWLESFSPTLALNVKGRWVQ